MLENYEDEEDSPGFVKNIDEEVEEMDLDDNYDNENINEYE